MKYLSLFFIGAILTSCTPTPLPVLTTEQKNACDSLVIIQKQLDSLEEARKNL